MTQAIVKIGKMSKGGRIINISSIVSKMGMSMTGTYTAAKAAADACSACWAQEVSHPQLDIVSTDISSLVFSMVSQSILCLLAQHPQTGLLHIS